MVDAAEARVRQARARPNPVLDMSLENAYGTGGYSGTRNADTSLSVSQNLELWGRRSSRVASARADAGVALLQRDQTVTETAGRLALAYADAEAAQRRAELAKESLTLTLADARAAMALVSEGREPLLRGIQAESEAASARATLDEAEAERDAAYALLGALGMVDMQVTAISASLLDQAPSGSVIAAERSPAVKVAEAQRTAAERRIAVEQAAAKPDVSVNVGVTRMAQGDTAMTFGVSVPLPLFNRNEGNIDAARAEFRAAQARVASVRQEALSERMAATARLSASASRVGAADAGVSAAEEAYRLARIGFEAGRISQLELRATRTALISARQGAVEARLSRVRAEIDLAGLDGRIPFEGAL